MKLTKQIAPAYSLLALSSTALAQVVQHTGEPPHPPLIYPSVATLVGPAAMQFPACTPAYVEQHPPTVLVTGQDKDGNWVALAYAQVFCGGVYRGCADVTWDPTGATVISYKIRFQEKDHFTNNRERKDDINKRCFDGRLLIS
jgi:hypothetical protein